MWQSILQNDFLLLAVGLFPAACVVIPLLFACKMYKKTAYAVLTVTLAASIALTTTVGAINLSEAVGGDVSADKQAYTPTGDEYLSVFSGFMLEGGYDEAEDIINDYIRTYGYDNTAATMAAELAFCNGDYSSALSKWRSIDENNLPEEAVAAEQIVRYRNMLIGNGGNMSDNEVSAVKGYLDNNGQGAKALIEKKFSSRADIDGYREAAKLVLRSKQLFETDETVIPAEEIKELLSLMKDIENSKVLNAVSPWRVGKLKVNIMNGDYDYSNGKTTGAYNSIVEGIDEFATAEEYSAMLDLYMGGKISSDTLKKAFDLKAPEGSDAVKKQLKAIRSNSKIELEPDKELLIDETVKEIEHYKGNEITIFFEDALLGFINDPLSDCDKSKLYFQLATLASINGDTAKQNEYFNKAISFGGASVDDLFRDAMNGLANILTGVRDISKSTKEYAEQAAENRYYLEDSKRYLNIGEKDRNVATELQSYTVKTGVAINIQSVDISNFPEVKANVLVSDEFLTEKEMKDEMQLRDCNRIIENYTLEKVSFDSANYILVTDNSGSMSGEIGTLKTAMTAFVSAAEENDNYAFYSFNSNIIQRLPLGTATTDDVMNAIQSMYDNGGTSIFNTLLAVLDETAATENTNNVIILFTDGEDGDYYGNSIYTVSDTIIERAKNKGYVIYMVALGSADNMDYFTYLAEGTGGSAISSTDSAQLEAFYAFIRSQAENKYTLTYTAQDSTSDIRPIEMSFESMNVSDIRYYSISGEDVTENDGEASEGYTNGKEVYGLATKLLYSSDIATDISIRGRGFDSSDVMYAVLEGERTYNLRAEYADANTFVITVPAGISVGVYDARITLNNGYKLFKGALCVTDGKALTTTFGEYSFESTTKQVSGSRTVLSGNVTMNGWLKFNGDVVLEGDITKADSITLYDQSGSSVSYQGGSGYTAYLAAKGLAQKLPALGTVRLYRNPDPNNAYTFTPGTDIVLENFFTLERPSLTLMPDSLNVVFRYARAELSSRDIFLYSTSTGFEPYRFGVEGSGSIGSNGVNISAAGGTASVLGTSVNSKIMNKDAIVAAASEMKFNTADGSARITYPVNIGSFLNTELDYSLEWKNMSIDGAKLVMESERSVSSGQLTRVFKPFSIGFSGKSAYTGNASVNSILALEMTGNISFDSTDSRNIISSLGYYMDEGSALKSDKVQISFTVGDFEVKGQGSVSFLGSDIDNAKVTIANDCIEITVSDGLSYANNGLEITLDDEVTIISTASLTGVYSYTGNASIIAGWWGETDGIAGRVEQLYFGLLDTSYDATFGLFCNSCSADDAASFAFHIGSGNVHKYIDRTERNAE